MERWMYKRDERVFVILEEARMSNNTIIYRLKKTTDRLGSIQLQIVIHSDDSRSE